MNRKGSTLWIGVMILLTIALFSYTLSVVWIKASSIGEDVVDARFLDSVYSREEVINYQIGLIVDRAALDVSGDSGKFVENFRKEFERLEGEFPEFEFIIPQLRVDNLEIDPDSGETGIKLNIKIEGEVTDEGFSVAKTSYIYEREFVAEDL